MEFKAICSNRVGSVYYVLLLHTVFLYDISLQRVCGFLEKADHNSSADYYGAGACISAQSGNEVSGTSSDEAVGTADEEQNKSKKNVARRCDRGAIVPSIIQSIQGIATGLPSEVKNIMDWSDEFFKGDSEIVGVINDVLQKASDAVQKFLENDLLAQVQVYLTSIASGVIYTLKFLLNLVVGIIVSIYVLASQETFAGQAKKIIYAMFKPVRANVIVETVRKSNEIFGGFISGKLLDSAIIGILAYVVLTIMRMPDTILLAVIIGVTNIIPFFGPFIGAIPSFLIVVLQNPLQGVYFLIFIFILQQIDGNIIGPKILGDSTGLSSFWVVFAILVFGGLWGFPGMLLGVPLMAVIYYVAQKLVSYFLRKRGLVDDTGSYIHLMRIDKRTNELVYEEKTEKGTEEKIEESPEK